MPMRRKDVTATVIISLCADLTADRLYTVLHGTLELTIIWLSAYSWQVLIETRILSRYDNEGNREENNPADDYGCRNDEEFPV